MTEFKWYHGLTLLTDDTAAQLKDNFGIDSVAKLAEADAETLTPIFGEEIAEQVLAQAKEVLEALVSANDVQVRPTTAVKLPAAFPWYLPIDAITYEGAEKLEEAGIDSLDKLRELAGSSTLAEILDDQNLAETIHEQVADEHFFTEEEEVLDDDDDDPVIEIDPNTIPTWVLPVSVIGLIGFLVGFAWIIAG